MIGLGLLLYVVGELSTLYIVLHVSLWVVLVGLAMTLIGPRGTKVIAFPLGQVPNSQPELPLTARAS